MGCVTGSDRWAPVSQLKISSSQCMIGELACGVLAVYSVQTGCPHHCSLAHALSIPVPLTIVFPGNNKTNLKIISFLKFL